MLVQSYVRPYCLTAMKSVSAREFYHNTALVDGLGEGKQLVVTANGKPKFIVTKGSRPRMTSALAARHALPSGKGPVDFTRFLKTLKK